MIAERRPRESERLEGRSRLMDTEGLPKECLSGKKGGDAVLLEAPSMSTVTGGIWNFVAFVVDR